MKLKLTYHLLLLPLSLFSQTSDIVDAKPLKHVLTEVETVFNISLDCPDTLVNGLFVSHAACRFRDDPEQTLINILSQYRLTFERMDDNKYKIKAYPPVRVSVEEGQSKLEKLSSLYPDLPSWERRKKELQECMLNSLRLSPLPENPGTPPIISNKRIYEGYSVENIAIETLPGLYVCGSLYRPHGQEGKFPVVLCPNGHFDGGRYRSDQQYRCAILARMGAIAFSYDLFAWGESLLQFQPEDHRTTLGMTIQALNSIRVLDYLLSGTDVDSERVSITGGSGGGSQAMLISALDERIKVSVPVVMLSAYFNGGCPCESGMPIHLCGNGTNNVEIAAMSAPKPQLVISNGKDWTVHVPEMEYPFLQTVYKFFGATDNVQNVHLPDEGHDYGIYKRLAMYEFLAHHLELNINGIKDKKGNIDESACIIEEEQEMYVFGKNGENLPGNAIRSFEELEWVFEKSVNYDCILHRKIH